jgi:hypothetical protein
MKKLLYVVTLVVALGGCGSGNTPSQQQAAAAPAPSKPAPPPRYFSLQDGLEYGYEQAVSSDAQNKGQVASNIMMFKFLGERDGTMQFYSRDGNYSGVLQCERPCEFVKQMFFYNGQLQRKEHIRAVEGSIAWALTRDAMNGYLKKYSKERDGKLQEVWFDESGPKWKPVIGS